MAGPTVSILLKEESNEHDKEEILVFIESISDKVHGNDFWVNGSPLGYVLRPDYPEEIDEYSSLKKIIGWSPKGIIGLYAMCNDNHDHFVLGKVALGISKIVSGKIAFHHLLKRYTEDNAILNNPGVVTYDSESILNPEVLELWLRHKDFCMVK
ncbi:MAG: DUF6368 family protein [Oleiphilus sp.]